MAPDKGCVRFTWPLHAFLCKCVFCLSVYLLAVHCPLCCSSRQFQCVFVCSHVMLWSASVFLLLSLLSFCLLSSVSFPFVSLCFLSLPPFLRWAAVHHVSRSFKPFLLDTRLFSSSQTIASLRCLHAVFFSKLKISCHRKVCMFFP